MFESVEFIEEEVVPGRPAPIPTESILGTFDKEADAVERARAARAGFMGAGKPDMRGGSYGSKVPGWPTGSRTLDLIGSLRST